MREFNNKLISALGGLSAFKTAVTIFVMGLLSGLAMPPTHVWWILFLTFPLVVQLVALRKSQHFRSDFLWGWLFGFGYFLSALHWIGFAFLINAADYLWMMPFAVGGLAATLAIYWGLAVAVAQICVKRGWSSILIYPLCFGIAEWLRGHLFTGFPWAVPGLAADGMGGVAQLASVIGMNGLTVVVLLWALTPLGITAAEKPMRLLSIFILASLPCIWVWGDWRISSNPTQYLDEQIVRLVQPNLSQDDKWRNNNARLIFDELLQLSAQANSSPEPTLIVWPESIVPFLIDESVEGKKELGDMLGGQKILLTGAVRRSSPRETNPNYFTSIIAFDGAGEVIGTYDKHHLVPGGEYLPLAWLLEPLGFRKVVNVPESFSEGVGPSFVSIPGVGRVAMQICYEAIFPQTLPSGHKRPDWLLNVTNDGWFGNSAGPYQHLAQLRMRAIEQGVGIIRVANTGISAVIDSTGGYVMQSRIGHVFVADSRIPKSLEGTIYSHWGDIGLIILSFGIVVLALVLRAKNRV
jgi:apolipoprotein N-acyltransferase